MTKKTGGLLFFLLTFLGATVVFHFILNGGAYWKEIRYDLFLRSSFASEDLTQGDILEVGQNVLLPGENFRLIIPKIGVDVPVISPHSPDKASVLAALESGVALYPGSSQPGEKGRAVILGHSSKATWYRGDYATIFSLIPQLNVGDTFYILEGDKKLTYRVFTSQILSPDQANRLFASEHVTPGVYTQPSFNAQGTVGLGSLIGSEIDLVTCFPIGSASNRNVVQAELINTEDL